MAKKMYRLLFLCAAVFVCMSAAASTAEAKARDNLDANGKAVYDAVKSGLVNVTKNGGSTIFEVKLDKLSNPAQFSITSSELGESPLGADGKITLKASRALALKVSSALKWNQIVFALEMDCPYELTWWSRDDNENDLQNMVYETASYSGGARVRCISFRVGFTVGSKYQDNNQKYVISAAAAGKFRSAAENAKKIVNDNAQKSDTEKLRAYKNEIRRLASQGGQSDSFTKRDLVSVFDGDSKTNPTCFGYSRAFQYLCDLSKFSSNKVQCRTVSVIMEGYGHACNIVTLDDGKNYLVDVTNCDANDNLFLKAATAGSVDCGYIVSGYTYAYWGGYYGFTHAPKDSVKLERSWIYTKTLWGSSQLALASGKGFISILGATPGADDNTQAVNVFHDSKSQVWRVKFNNSAYLEWKLPSKIAANQIVLATASDASKNPGRNPASWVLKARNSTQESWKELTRVSGDTFMKNVNGQAYAFHFNNSTAYQYYRLEISKTQGSTDLCISKVEVLA